MMGPRDYFTYETIRDHEHNVVCYYVTAIGTIEEDGAVHLRGDMGPDKDEKMAFGRITLHNQDRKISTLLKETNSRVYYHIHDEEGSVDVISFTARNWRADEAYELEAGDRVMVQGRAYLRKNDVERYPGRLPEISITVSGLFRLSKAHRPRFQGMNASLIPQK